MRQRIRMLWEQKGGKRRGEREGKRREITNLLEA